jgi:excisionase family DNA binding protein
MMTVQPHTDELTHRTLTVEEAAKVLGIGRNTAYEAAKSGDLPTVRVGGRLLVPRARLLALLGELPNNEDSEGGESIEEANGPGASASASERGDVTAALE